MPILSYMTMAILHPPSTIHLHNTKIYTAYHYTHIIFLSSFCFVVFHYYYKRRQQSILFTNPLEFGINLLIRYLLLSARLKLKAPVL